MLLLGDSENENLYFSDFKNFGDYIYDGPTYSLDANLRYGGYQSVQNVFGQLAELVELDKHLDQVLAFKLRKTSLCNIDKQLELQINVQNLGHVRVDVVLNDRPSASMRVSYDTEFASLDRLSSWLKSALKSTC
jgi:hypothetical protein